MRHHGDVFEVLRRSAQQRDTADIDLLDRFARRDARPRDRFFERIKIDDDGCDLGYGVFFRLQTMLVVGAIVEDRSKNLRVKALYAAAEERGKTSYFFDRARRHAGLFEIGLRAAGRIDLEAVALERSGELHRPGTI